MNNKKLIEAFCNALEIEASIVKDDLQYQSIEQWDSISHMILIAELEDVFDVEIDTDDVIDMSSVAKSKEILNKNGIKF
ncbi:Acyl carrier protein [Polaribacter huanghezhanensis]|uniref:acyl carrier protein n=1 Tax=Polaribacter huanghezhanensis TaxID=1354726 RepID=UPI0026470764|nr:acyl carrier protein [Polaribacter huanghezhanensis]WKD86112.1 Acyl carrier protein [Polaribacter huanghezhanensis]